MSDVPSVSEVEGQDVELLPSRVVLSLIGDGGPGADSMAGGAGGWGLTGADGGDARSFSDVVIGADGADGNGVTVNDSGVAGADGTHY